MEKVEENNTNKKVRKEASSGLIITAIVLSYFIGFVTGFFVINNAIVQSDSSQKRMFTR